MAWNKLGTTTLGSAGDDLDITSMTANKFNQFMVHTPIDNASNNINHRYTILLMITVQQIMLTGNQ
jgi:hypothetical protein